MLTSERDAHAWGMIDVLVCFRPISGLVRSGPGEFFFWTHFRLSLWELDQLRMRS